MAPARLGWAGRKTSGATGHLKSQPRRFISGIPRVGLLGRTNQRNPRPEWTEEFYKDFYTLSDADKMRVFAENEIPEDLRPEFERISEQIKMPVTDLDNELIAAYEGNKDYLTEGDLNDIKKLIELRAELNRK